MTDAFARFLAERGIALVLADRKGTPDLFDLWLEVGTGVKFAMIRWIGDDRNGPQGDREISAPQDEKLDLWAERLRTLNAAGIDSFGYVHNPYEGHSPGTVRRLLDRLGANALPWAPGDVQESLPDDDDNDAAQMRLL
jgi:uncharacterized protein YecE (DUF72 family)